ncbi:alpha-ribazole phosphatase [Jimgerdemannia flammicorona]|uniref:Alpha-ribazole phosphatase n=1 Tax=Jimgerdemannia flammicorona TaxID=994334 RepID=A0A433QE05_9FUNG|nr:alpha-ribazole phosphatase [Jimgerdemannia flammicorona]
MPRPTHIILVRHGESEGNLDHSLFQRKPDHRHKLTERGHEQAFTAGRRLRELLEGGNKVQFYVSPYQRTRETFRGLMRGLTGLGEEKADVGEGERWKGKVTYFEEPRLREQGELGQLPARRAADARDSLRTPAVWTFVSIEIYMCVCVWYLKRFCSDVYDRLSTFIDTLHRAFERTDFPDKCVIVTHGLLIRLFLMRWYHYRYDEYEASVHAMENLGHCEFVVMRLDPAANKYHLATPLRRWPTEPSTLDRAAADFEDEPWAHMLHAEGDQEDRDRRRGRHWWELSVAGNQVESQEGTRINGAVSQPNDDDGET